jgi:RNA polymerase sigma-70 factor
LSKRKKQLEQLIADGAANLLERATESRKLDASLVAKRIRQAVEKYVLQDEPNANHDSINSFIDGLQADDLCLVMACERGDQTAWDDLVARFTVTVRSAARNASSNEDAAEDLAQSIWAELHGLKRSEDGTARGKLGYYSGRGSLAGWLRAVVAQLAVDQHRKQARLVQTDEDADFDRAELNHPEHGSTENAHIPDPEEAVTTNLAVRELRGALQRAIENLGPDDRLLVQLYYFDELRLREAGAVLGVHEATASRRLSKIHQELRRSVKEFLTMERGWTANEAERAFSEVALHMDADVERMVTPQQLDEPAASGG